MYKKLLVLFGIAALSVTLVACSNGQKAGDYTIYETNSIKTSTTDSGSWLVKGKTNAPDGSKILIVPSESDNPYYKVNVAKANSDKEAYAKVEDGKFSAKVSAYDITTSDESYTGDKYKVQIMAIKNYTTPISSLGHVGNTIIKVFKDNFKPYTLEITEDQTYYLSDDEDSEEDDSDYSYSSSTSSSSSEKNYEAVSYDNLARNPDDYKFKPVTITGQVMQAQKSGKGYMLLVWQNDDSDQMVMVMVPKSYKPDNGNILEDDEVTINGYAFGTQEYDTTGGSTNDVPLIYADQAVVDNGKSSNAY